ncbi:TetR/AcrR family transcriptional regulator [Sulfurospirillum sp. 1612]|uniref:TetR/AcrR family transcriptional regulator n=1 Tax=Sulfurospirillum sp. 1612 TaxID=3094835 RepID=UPI002F94544B
MAKKTRNTTVSKKLILENAIKLFSTKGYGSSSMEELATMCGLNKAMIFYYFKNKQGLYDAVIEMVIDEIYQTVHHDEEKVQDPMAELEYFIKTYASFACVHPYLPALLLRELSASGAAISEKLFFKMRKLFVHFSDILRRGEEEGIFKDAIPMVLYFMVLGTINLIITTKPLRIKAQEIEGIDTCAQCDINDMSEYLVKKIKKMLKE